MKFFRMPRNGLQMPVELTFNEFPEESAEFLNHCPVDAEVLYDYEVFGETKSYHFATYPVPDNLEDFEQTILHDFAILVLNRENLEYIGAHRISISYVTDVDTNEPNAECYFHGIVRVAGVEAE